MSKTATTRSQDPNAISKTLSVAFELGEREWKLRWASSLGTQPGGVTLPARATRRVLEVLERARERAGATRIVSCYEAGRDGFWLHRFLVAQGIDNRIVDAASIEVNRRARRRKTDRLDAHKLLTMLLREQLGEEKVWSVVRVPSVEDEDARCLQREYRTLVKERTRSANRIQGLLANHGLTVSGGIDATFPQWLDTARLWDGSALPRSARDRILREYERWRFTHEQILGVEKQRRDRLKDEQDASLEKVRRLFSLRGIGIGAAFTYGLELFSWREFGNGKEVGALAGLAPTPYQSGDQEHELGISRAGNRWVRGLAIEIAWGWLRHQPNSAPSRNRSTIDVLPRRDSLK